MHFFQLLNFWTPLLIFLKFITVDANGTHHCILWFGGPLSKLKMILVAIFFTYRALKRNALILG